jgi:hypothetical protein
MALHSPQHTGNLYRSVRLGNLLQAVQYFQILSGAGQHRFEDIVR